MRYHEILREFQHSLDAKMLKRVIANVWHNTDWGGGDGEGWYYDFHHEYPECNSEQRRINKRNCERVFKRWFKEQVEDKAAEVYDEITSRFEGKHLPIYRMITAPKDWRPHYGPNALDPRQPDLFPGTFSTTPEFTHPGIYWSWEEDAAEAHWGDGGGGINWLITGAATADQIDWETTLSQNCQRDYADEKEVRIRDGADIDVISVKPRSAPRGWR